MLLNYQRREASFDSDSSPNWTSTNSRGFVYPSKLKGSIWSFLKNRKQKKILLQPPLFVSSSTESAVEKTLDLALSPAISPIPTTTCRYGRRRTSIRPRELLAPRDFAPYELRKPLALSRCCCISQQDPEPGFRVSRKARSGEKCFVTTLPQYSAKHNSPLVTQKPTTIYFEAQIRSGNDDGEVNLALGFAAGRPRATHMPGFENGTLGIQCRDGRFFLNGKALEGLATREFEPYDRVGIGMVLSRRSQDVPAAIASTSALDIQLFLTRDGNQLQSLKLQDLTDQSTTQLFEGFDGAYDLYPAVGVIGEASADILFEQEDWKYVLEVS